MTTLSLKSGKVVVDASGKPVDCPGCACGWGVTPCPTVQTVHSNQVSGLTASATWPAATTDGNLLVALITIHGSATITGTSSGWVQAATAAAPGSAGRVYIYYINAAASRSGAEGFTLSAPAFSWTTLIEDGSGGTIDQTATNSGTSAHPDSGTTLVTTSASEMAFAVLFFDGSTTALSSSTDGFTKIYDDADGMPLYYGAVCRGGANSTMTADCSMTASGSGAWAGAVATFVCGTGFGGCGSQCLAVPLKWNLQLGNGLSNGTATGCTLLNGYTSVLTYQPAGGTYPWGAPTEGCSWIGPAPNVLGGLSPQPPCYFWLTFNFPNTWSIIVVDTGGTGTALWLGPDDTVFNCLGTNQFAYDTTDVSCNCSLASCTATISPV